VIDRIEVAVGCEALLTQLDLEQLTALRTHLKRTRAWMDPTSVAG
jgi:hypothetical protein